MSQLYFAYPLKTINLISLQHHCWSVKRTVLYHLLGFDMDSILKISNICVFFSLKHSFYVSQQYGCRSGNFLS